MIVPNICMTGKALQSDISSLQSDGFGERNDAREVRNGSDLCLIQRCGQRDPVAMREIVGRYQQRLYRFLRQILESHEDTEEAVMEVFMRVWLRADGFEGRACVATWLYRIAANVAYDLLRQRKRHAGARVTVDWAATDRRDAAEIALENWEREERAHRLQNALQTLRVEDRLLLTLYYEDDLTYADIQKILHIPYPLLKVRLMRARKRLRTAVGLGTSEAER